MRRSGKTTLAHQLGERLRLPVMHTDSFYWRNESGIRVESTAGQWQSAHEQMLEEALDLLWVAEDEDVAVRLVEERADAGAMLASKATDPAGLDPRRADLAA